MIFTFFDVNPEDIPSRGIAPKLLSSSSLWWNGPSWLCQTADHWPSHFSVNDTHGHLSEDLAVSDCVVRDGDCASAVVCVAARTSEHCCV